jgi:hypothetical protein
MYTFWYPVWTVWPGIFNHVDPCPTPKKRMLSLLGACLCIMTHLPPLVYKRPSGDTLVLHSTLYLIIQASFPRNTQRPPELRGPSSPWTTNALLRTIKTLQKVESLHRAPRTTQESTAATDPSAAEPSTSSTDQNTKCGHPLYNLPTTN